MKPYPPPTQRKPLRPVADDDKRPWVAIAANPYSGKAANVLIVEQLTSALDRLGYATRLLWQQNQYALVNNKQWMTGCQCVVAAGGDGTLASVVNHKPITPIALLPLGCENLLAGYLKLNIPVQQLAQAIHRGQTRSFDLGLINDTRFTLMVSVGLDSDVVRRISQWRSTAPAGLQRVGRNSYLLPTLRGLGSYQFPSIKLTTDTGQSVTGRHVFVFNFSCYGFNFNFVPDASGDDGLLDWIVLKKPGRLALLNYAQAIWRGKHLNRSDIAHGQARSIRITTDTHEKHDLHEQHDLHKKLHCQADGDLRDPLPVTINTLPGRLKMIMV